MHPTKTTNRLHFTDLEPLRFEDLCLNIIQRQKDWKDIRHYGRSGSDEGIDILGIDKKDESWYFQCKRYKSITKSELENTVDKIIHSATSNPNNIILFVACDVSKNHYEHFVNKCNELNIKISVIWTASKIEAELYKKHHDLLFTYFGISIPKVNVNNATKLRHSLRMKKKIEKLFIRKDLDFDTVTNLTVYEPHCRFNVGEMIIRNLDNDIYPHHDEDGHVGISNWFKVELYDLVHNGVEMYLHQSKLIIDKNDNWDILEDENDERANKYEVLIVNTVGRIEYSNIVELDFDGDEYFPYPHLFCRFDIDGMPYGSIEYYTYGDSRKKIIPFHFEKRFRNKLV